LVNQGIKPQTAVKEAVRDVDYVVTSLPKTQDVETLLYSEDGVFENASEGTCIVDSSTISAIAAKEFSQDAIKRKMTYCDAPMSGGVAGATAGTLTFMVGSNSVEDFEKAKIVLEGMGTNIFHCGGPGTGETAKIANNLILGIQMIASAEGMVLGEKLGIDPKILMQILAVSTASNWCIKTNNPRPGNLENAPASKNYDGGFQVGLMRKDLALSLECAEAVGAQTEFAKKALDYYMTLEKKGYGGKDFGYVF
jgi:3-hydroxyisobutyrate dehydrogenase